MDKLWHSAMIIMQSLMLGLGQSRHFEHGLRTLPALLEAGISKK
jgi:hypothetical protein